MTSEERANKYAETLSKMLRCETVSVMGQTDMTKFRSFHGLLKELFPALFAELELEEFNGSLLMKWKGSNPQAEPVMFMNHLDVVEAQSEWKHGPFSGDIADGKVWGRGALDDKGGLWGMLQAADELVREGFKPQTDVYFESACTEEIDGEGAYTIAQELEKRGMHFSMILDEGGMIMEEPIAGAKGTYAMVGMGEKNVVELRFVARSGGGHASTPEKDTPLVRLGKFMREVDRNKLFRAEVSPVIAEMFSRLSPSIEGPLKTVFAHPKLFAPLLKVVMPMVSGTANALLRTTVAFTMAGGSDARNVIPAEAWVVGNMRISHHQGYEESMRIITKTAAKYGVETEVLLHDAESPLADFNSAAFKNIEAAVDHAYKGVATVPYVMTGASDGRFMGKLTENCFRFVPFIIDEQQLESIHGIDENVDISTLVPAVEFYRYLFKEIK